MLIPNVLPEMFEADYWVRKWPADAGKIILTNLGIATYNRSVLQHLPHTVVDLAKYPALIPRATLLQWIKQVDIPQQSLFLDNQPVSSAYYVSLQDKLNLAALPEQIAILYGYTVTRTNLRTYPTDDPVLAEPDRPDFEQYQETGVNPAEPVVILHQSNDANWFFVQTGNYRGWAPVNHIAVALSKDQWLEYLNPTDFLRVIGSRLTLLLPDRKTRLLFEMGARIPLAAPVELDEQYLATLPQRNHLGQLYFNVVPIPQSSAVKPGDLAYTRTNLFRQAFQMLEQRYDWGGLNSGVDCSSFIMNSFHSFGLRLPRNSSEQATLPGKTINFTGDDISRLNALRHLQPGAILNMKGHVMFYLGEENGRPYILHALSSYGVPDATGGFYKTYASQVTVTDLFLTRADGQTFLASLNSGKNIG